MGGECKVFDDPGFAVQGARLKDKQWIGATQEKGIDVCGWKRPRAEPVRRIKKVVVTPVVAPVAEPATFPTAPVADPAPKRTIVSGRSLYLNDNETARRSAANIAPSLTTIKE
jgi:hypothetical protein